MNPIAKPSYTHTAMVDLLVTNPAITQREIAAYFGYTEGWVSQILRADAVRELIAARRNELFDPVVAHSIDKRMEALAHQSLEVLQEALQAERSPDVALKALDVTSRALGYGAKAAGAQIIQNFVVAMPEKSVSGEAWVERHHPASQSFGGRETRASCVTIDTLIDG